MKIMYWVKVVWNLKILLSHFYVWPHKSNNKHGREKKHSESECKKSNENDSHPTVSTATNHCRTPLKLLRWSFSSTIHL